MKRILVLSDSHGNVNNMIYAVKETDPDMIIHLGDCWTDAARYARRHRTPRRRLARRRGAAPPVSPHPARAGAGQL